MAHLSPRGGDKCAHVRWTSQPTLQSPVVIAAFEGWNDAGDAASTAVRYLVERWDVEQVADVDPEEFYDFTSTRPDVRLDEDFAVVVIEGDSDQGDQGDEGDEG